MCGFRMYNPTDNKHDILSPQGKYYTPLYSFELGEHMELDENSKHIKGSKYRVEVATGKTRIHVWGSSNWVWLNKEIHPKTTAEDIEKYLLLLGS